MGELNYLLVEFLTFLIYSHAYGAARCLMRRISGENDELICQKIRYKLSHKCKETPRNKSMSCSSKVYNVGQLL